jgi:hypothetical protein
MHMESMNFDNCIYAYKDRREGGGVRGLEVGFSFLCGNGIIEFSRFFVEGYREGWERG